MKLSCIVFQNKHVKIIRINYTIKYAKLHKMVIYRAFLVFFSNFGSILTYFVIVFGPWEFLKSLWWFWNDFININSYLLRPFIINRPSVPCSRMNWLEMKISLTYKKVKEPSCTVMKSLFYPANYLSKLVIPILLVCTTKIAWLRRHSGHKLQFMLSCLI